MAKLSSDFITSLHKLVTPGGLLTTPADCIAYSYDNSAHQSCPEAVIFPVTESQVCDIVSCCRQYQVPITARGRGTGTTGAAVPIQSGLVLSTERFDKIIKIDAQNRTMDVEPGVTNHAVQLAAKEINCFFAPDPSSSPQCSIGGNLAVGAAGPRAVKYGSTRENVLGLNAVIGTGELLECGVQTSKGVVGYDLTRLMIGSEGTLGIITKATLRLLPLKGALRCARFFYRHVDDASHAIVNIMQQGFTPCALEFMDHNAIHMIKQFSQVAFPSAAGAMIILEYDDHEQTIDFGFECLCKSAENEGLLEKVVAQTEQERKSLWQTRKALSPALRQVAPNKINEDIVVPISCLPTLIAFLDDLSAKHQVPIVNFGHAGNGNIHVNIMHHDEQRDAALTCLDALFTKVLALGGTLSGEHGTGLCKLPYLQAELQPAALNIMQAIKRVFDPDLILNPGKI